MEEIRKKQNKLHSFMKALIIFSAIFIFIYIGAKPYVAEYNQVLAVIINYICDILVIAVLVMVFIYYSKYGKCESFLNYAEDEITDCGYYYSARKKQSIDEAANSIKKDLLANNYSINEDIEVTDFTFDIKGVRRNDYFYIVNLDVIDKNDILAYLDEVITDVTIKNVKRKGDIVLCFICNNADDEAIALSKMITPLGKKETIKIAICIYQPNEGIVYFQGKQPTKNQSVIANYIMKVDIPIDDKYKSIDKLPFQYELEEKMKSFDLTKFKNNEFFLH